MKGELASIPSIADLEGAYNSLVTSEVPSPGKLALYTQWSRFDPRLSEIWVAFIGDHWPQIHPILLRDALVIHPWPAAAAVLLEFTKTILFGKIQKYPRPIFAHWAASITEGLRHGRDEQYFIGLRQMGSESMSDDARFSMSEYRKWGYLSRENLINKDQISALTLETRYEIAKSLLEKMVRFRIDDYWEAVGRCVSRRQSERDLKRCPFLQIKGHTKGRYYIAKSRKS